MTRSADETLEVRSLAHRELREAALLQVRELPGEFLSRAGERFLARYYRAFLESPHATALAAIDRRTGRLEGVFIATFDTGAHYSYLVRRHGVALAVRAAVEVLLRPSLARDFLETRPKRYLRGVLRSLIHRKKKPESAPERVGFPTYIAVRGDHRSRGIGAALFEAYEQIARKAGLGRLELATRPGKQGAGPFFVKLGYHYEGERTSRSGERYAFYTKSLVDEAC